MLSCVIYLRAWLTFRNEVGYFQPDLLSLVMELIRGLFAPQFLCVVHSPLSIFPTLGHPDFVPSMARTKLRQSG